MHGDVDQRDEGDKEEDGNVDGSFVMVRKAWPESSGVRSDFHSWAGLAAE